jgi:hypothetical protein
MERKIGDIKDKKLKAENIHWQQYITYCSPMT